MLELIKDEVSKVESEFCEIRYEVLSGTQIVVSETGVEEVSFRDNSGGAVRLIENGGLAFSSFNSIDRLRDIIKTTRTSVKTISSKSNVRLSSYQPVVNNIKTQYQIDPRTISLDDKVSLCNSYASILKSNPKVRSIRVRYLDYNLKKYYVNSEGSAIEMEFNYIGTTLVAYAVDGSNVQRAVESIARYGGYEVVNNLDTLAEEVSKRAVDLLYAEQVEGGTYNVIIDPRLAGVFAHEAFGHLSEADHVYGNNKLMEVMKLGRRFGPEFLNIIDDGNIPEFVGYTPYDDEGIPAQRTYLVKDGVLNARLHSRLTSKMMNEPLSGNARALSYEYPPIVRMTNTFIDNGDTPVEELFEKLGDGLYVIDFIGGQTNLEMFTFSAAYGYKVENGKKTKLMRDITLTGNVFETIKNISAIGNDLKLHSTMGGCGKSNQSPLPVSDGGPHILVNNILIGGRT
ncbi:MAG: TldD/PmbA family protein [Spirochaetia bacterium]|nr:TldD/PmbA family protein [Spirochaetota bacterium]MCX8097130.1 TldD/PmbA family protein [Spirochaetota bacterium]MDW8112101.1 TldD/PmbA family protein [Spirochaetia bacterium]